MATEANITPAKRISLALFSHKQKKEKTPHVHWDEALEIILALVAQPQRSASMTVGAY